MSFGNPCISHLNYPFSRSVGIKILYNKQLELIKIILHLCLYNSHTNVVPLTLEKINMLLKPLNIVAFSLLLPLMACNAKTNSSSVTPSAASPTTTKAADPIPQTGGYSNIDNTKLKELITQGVTIVDIRLEEEWRQTGIVEGSKTITFFDNMGRINPNFVPEFTALVKQDQPVALICRTGNRTQAASQAIAQQLGYKSVMNVTHGITGWIAEKRPVTKYQK